MRPGEKYCWLSNVCDPVATCGPVEDIPEAIAGPRDLIALLNVEPLPKKFSSVLRNVADEF
jgi:hypothetical protein